MTIEQKAKAYEEVVGKLKRFIVQGVDPLITKADVQDFFPELKVESEDEKIRKALIRFHKSTIDIDGIKGEDIIAWLEKQGKQKPNPYSGVSFEYNGHTWGMCARDCGVEILVDGEIKERVFLDNKPHDARENLTLDGDLMQADCMIVERNPVKKPQRMISAEAKEAMYDKPAWSEEDEKMISGLKRTNIVIMEENVINILTLLEPALSSKYDNIWRELKKLSNK